MTRLHALALALLLVAISALANHYGPYRLVNDQHDIGVYFERGLWVYPGRQAYSDVFSEYPQVATAFFALPHLLANDWIRTTADVEPYRYVFTALMAVLLALTVQRTHAMRRDRRALAFLLLLPAGWYFAHNRFDIIPALLTLLALDALRRDRLRLAFAVLGVATMTKWYALVIAPVFAVYLWQTRRRALAPCLAVYGGTVGLLVLPTLLTAGLDGFLVPYRFHLGRSFNEENLLALLLRTGLLDWVPQPVLFKVFLAGQLAAVPLSLRARVDTWERVLKWSALSVLCFMLFAKFYSPQWLLWVTPMLLLLVRRRAEVVGVVALDLVTFVYFPLLFDRQFDLRPLLDAAVAAKTLVVGAWLVHLLRRAET